MYVIKIKHHILLALLVSFSGTAFSQTRAETIPWSEDRKLQWSNFKGSYLKTQWAAATTATSISYSFSVVEIYANVLKQLYIFQNKYDRETNFSRDLQQQLVWKRMIAKELASIENQGTNAGNPKNSFPNKKAIGIQ